MPSASSLTFAAVTLPLRPLTGQVSLSERERQILHAASEVFARANYRLCGTAQIAAADVLIQPVAQLGLQGRGEGEHRGRGPTRWHHGPAQLPAGPAGGAGTGGGAKGGQTRFSASQA